MKQTKMPDGVIRYELDVHDCMHDEEAEKLLGQFIDHDSYNIRIDYDADLYGPADVYGNRDLVLCFRKNVFPKDITKAAFKGVYGAIGETNNRGLAAGPRDQISGLGSRNWVLDENGKPTGQIYKKSGGISTTHYAVPVESGLGGYFDRYVRIPYCRPTSYTKANLEKWNMAVPFMQAISEQFRIHHPTKWANQKKAVDGTTPEFVIPGTVFTTATINRTWRTACHRDAGDLMEGFGNITVLENGKYSGAELCMPKFRVAVDVREGDVLLFNVHEIHGNMPIVLDEEKAERISVVCYYRENMGGCGSKAYEDARYRFVKAHQAKMKEAGELSNGVFPGMWTSDQWHQYLLDNGLLEDAKRDFPHLYEETNSLEAFFS